MGENSAPRTQRQLRVGEELRHSLATIFLQESFYEPAITGISITVSEVRVSADLRNATAFVSPLGGKPTPEFLIGLNKITPQIRFFLAKKVKLKYLPDIYFKVDTSYEYAQKIDSLLDTPSDSIDISE
jgi:ribosome-binding factor A